MSLRGPAIWSSASSRATAPNQLWVADITYVATWSGFVYVAFVTDVFSRRIVGWQASTIAARRPGPGRAWRWRIWTPQRRHDLSGLVHHSDRGVQYLSIRYTERLADEGAVDLGRFTRRHLRQRHGRDHQRASTRPS